jgi:hypothetical protein
MTIAQNLNSVLNKIAAAQVAARILRPTSWYDRPEWELNGAQQASMRKTISKAAPTITEDRLKWFAQQTCFAIGDLQAARELGVSVLATTVGLKAVATAAGELARTWNQLSQPLQAHLSERLVAAGSQDERFAIAAIAARTHVAERIDTLLSDGLWGLVGEIATLLDALRNRRTRGDAFAHWFTWRIAQAWFSATGKLPTLTRNKDAVSGSQMSDFEEFLRAVVPKPSIGSGVLRDVVEAFKASQNGTTAHNRLGI